jgi:glycerophosphoryl diester phosphodiesterase
MKPAVYGHRGARWLFPENTIVGFQGALALGVDGIEMDAGMTGDGTVIVAHDLDLNPEITRGPDGAWLRPPTPALRALTFAQTQHYDVGRIDPKSPYAARFPAQTAHDGARMPAFAEVLALPAQAALMVETKTNPTRQAASPDPVALTDAVVRLADAAGAAARLIVQSFDWRGLRHLRRTRPEIAVSFLTEARTVANPRAWWDGVGGASIPRAVAAAGGEIWGPDASRLTEAELHEAKALGLRVVPWTVNGEQAMRRLLAWGVDGLITDRPDLAIALIGGSL